MDRPSPTRARALARRYRPALLLSAGALVIAVAGTVTGAALAGGHDEHGWTEHSRQVEHRDVPPNRQWTGTGKDGACLRGHWP